MVNNIFNENGYEISFAYKLMFANVRRSVPFLWQNDLRALKNILENQNILSDVMTSVCSTKSKYSWAQQFMHIAVAIAEMVHTRKRPIPLPIQMNNMQSIKFKATERKEN